MYAVPTVLDAEPWARLPDAFRKLGRCTWSEVNNGGRDTDCFLEGPAFDRDGRLYVTDIPYGRIFRVESDGRFELVCEYDGEPNGLKFHPDGRLFIADYKNGIMALDVANGRMEEVVGRRHTETFKGVNDLFFAASGDLYFTDQGQTGVHDPTGRVYRLTPSGQLHCLLQNVPSPNGVCLNLAQTHLLLAVTRGNCVWRAPLMGDGTLSKVGVFIQMSGGVGPDGIAVDEEDSLAVAHPGLGGAWIFDRRGVPSLFVRTPVGDFPTNLAYGGPDRRDLYIVESHTGSILRARLPVAGRALLH